MAFDNEESSTDAELARGQELKQKEAAAEKEAEAKALEEQESDGLDAFQRQQEEATHEQLEKLRKESEGGKMPRTVAMSPEYSPPGTIRGTDGSNANFNPDKVSDPNAEWDPHGGEEDQAEGGEPKKIPE